MGTYNIRDGVMSVNGNGGGLPNYEPNSLNGPKECKSYAISKVEVSGHIGRYPH
jgi:catalase